MGSKKLSNSTAHPSKESKNANDGKAFKLSTEYVEDSNGGDSESDEMSSTPEKSRTSSRASSNAPTGEQKKSKPDGASGQKLQVSKSKHNTNGSRATRSSRDTSDSSDSDKNRSSKTKGKAKNAIARSGQKQVLAETTLQSSSSSDSEEESSDDAAETETADVVMRDARWATRLALREGSNVSSEPAEHSSRVVAARSKFKPPKGFKAVAIPKDLNSLSVFTPQNISGKQIWHIVAPPNVPISSITAATLLQHQNQKTSGHFAPQETVATHKGTEYALVEVDGQDLRRRAYRPDPGSENYSVIGTSISRVLRLQRKPLSKLGITPSNGAEGNALEARTHSAPPQPEGLRLRYQPFGVSSDALLSRINQPSEVTLAPSSGAKSANASTEKRKPAALPSTDSKHGPLSTNTKRRKHKHSASVDEESASAVVAESDHDAAHMNEGEPQQEDSETPEQREKRRAERKREKEERRARKAERRAKREAAAASAV